MPTTRALSARLQATTPTPDGADAAELTRYRKKPTVTSRKLQTSVRLVLPGCSPSTPSPRALS